MSRLMMGLGVYLTCDVQTTDHVIFWQGELKSLGVMVVIIDFKQLQGKEALLSSSKSLLWFASFFSMHWMSSVAQICVAKGA